MVKELGFGRLAVLVLCIIAVLSVTVCLADGGSTAPGEPTTLPPGCKTLEPTPSILSEFVTVLVTVVTLSLF